MRRLALILFVALFAGSAAAATPNADQKRARAALVKLGDLDPSYTVDKQRIAEVGIPNCPGAYTPKQSDLTITGQAASFFRNRISAVSSDVALFKSRAQLATWWGRAMRPAFATCLASTLKSHAEPKLLARIVTARTLDTPRFAERVAGYRVALTYRVNDDERVLNRDILFFAWDRGVGAVVLVSPNGPCTCLVPLAFHVSRRLAGVRGA